MKSEKQEKMKTENDAYLTLAALCAQAEHCQYEMLEKMRKWELSEECQARIMERLVKERYIDDERFARARLNKVCGRSASMKTSERVF